MPRRTGNRRRTLAFAGLIALATLPRCTSIAAPSAADAADSFLRAWGSEDWDAMAASLASESQGDWTADELERFIGRALERGKVTAIEIERTARVDQPELDDAAAEVEVPYAIEYTSEASSRPARLQGSFTLVYESEPDRWAARWDEAMLWPGVERAARFRIAYRWPRRAAILDRERRPLAKGPVERRSYPFGSTGGNVVGHVAPLDQQEAGEIEGLRTGDLVGASGLEAGLQERLAGEPGTRLTVVDASGRVLRRLGSTAPDRGRPARTTLDIDVQRAAQIAFGGTVGGAVVLDPRSGDLLAAVTSSPFDPNNYVGVPNVSPFDRALSGLYPPGSAMKVVTASAALEAGVVKPSTMLTGPSEYNGVRNFESGEFGALDFATAVKFSVNTAFAQVALDLGARRITRFAEAFGFNHPPSMPLGAATSSFPVPEDEGDLMWGSIGQAQVLASPLQMATVAATIANRGKRMEPRVLVGSDKDGQRAVSVKVARTMTGLMEAVVQGGTGTAAQISGVTVAGKTGTAEVDVNGERKNHAWFVCFAPSDDPQVAVAVVSEYGGVGGQVAAPLARSILERVLPLVP